MFNGIYAWKDPSLVKKKSYKCVHLFLCNPINLKVLRDKSSQYHNLVSSHNAAVPFRDTLRILRHSDHCGQNWELQDDLQYDFNTNSGQMVN